MTERAPKRRKKAKPGPMAGAVAAVAGSVGPRLLRLLFPLLVAGAAAALFCLFRARYYFGNGAFLVRPEEIVVRGGTTLTREEVLLNFGLDAERNGFEVMRSDIVARLHTQDPRIRNAEMTFQPGRSLELWVEERTPIARLQSAPLFVVDEEGVCLRGARSYGDLPTIGGFDLPASDLAPGHRLPPQTRCMLHLIAAAASEDYRLPGDVRAVSFLYTDADDGLVMTLGDGRRIVIAWPGMAGEEAPQEGMYRRLTNVAMALRNPHLAGKRHFNAMAADAVTVSD